MTSAISPAYISRMIYSIEINGKTFYSQEHVNYNTRRSWLRGVIIGLIIGGAFAWIK